MEHFMIQFFLCNLFICIIVGILLVTKRLFKNILTSRMQYNLWFLLLLLLAVPFLPVEPVRFLPIFSWLQNFRNTAALYTVTSTAETVASPSFENSNWMQDFTLSVTQKTPSVAGRILFFIWMIGIFAMIMVMIRSKLHLNKLKQSALPLQNKEVRSLYNQCLTKMHITKEIPIYSTAFLKSPIMVGLLKPCIYLPIYLISDYNATDLRYMLLHELQHYKHKDALINHFMNIAGVLYWFHPFVWYALTQMRNDREIACDTSVLQMLREEDYEGYGNTLIHIAEKVSLMPFPFSSGISGTMRQMKKRITNIASFEKPSARKRRKSITAFLIIALLLSAFIPVLSTCAVGKDHYPWDCSLETISYADYSSYFGEYEGSFVLYDLENQSWIIHNMERATLQVSPNSTYKIYDALFALEEGIITPDNSYIAWDKHTYPFEAWNKDHNLSSAMHSSVNWYFQKLDEQLGASCLSQYIQKIGYGNKDISGNFPTYWMESSLKISPVEQVKLLTKLYKNRFHFATENVNAVKNAMFLSSSGKGKLYGKTGTGRVNEKDVNGWFVGYVECSGKPYFFAINITADENATGSEASEIGLSILSDLHIW